MACLKDMNSKEIKKELRTTDVIYVILNGDIAMIDAKDEMSVFTCFICNDNSVDDSFTTREEAEQALKQKEGEQDG